MADHKNKLMHGRSCKGDKLATKKKKKKVVYLDWGGRGEEYMGVK